MKQGKVWLIGAGPSDAGLFTIKGKQLLEKADVVVYDKLVGQGILSMIPHSARRIDVGKRSGHHPVPQEEINQILLCEAKKGLRVVRLKGGDPFLFGRGGEELELLHENKIPFEIVPGITSAIAVPAYAGIPVTHRDCCSSLHIITAHKKRGSEECIDYSKLVGLDGTLIFLMGVSALPDICTGLLKAGMDATMPAAVLERGTTAKQRPVISTLENLPIDAQNAKIQTPAIIVVGKVCALSEEFHWAEDRILGGARVIVTRPKESASRLTEQLQELGAEVLELPCIQTTAIDDLSRFHTTLHQLNRYQWLVFTSAVAVELFFSTLKNEHLDLRCLFGIKLAAVGAATKQAIEQHGLLTEAMPALFNGAELSITLAALVQPNERLLLLRAKEVPPDLTDGLLSHGISFDEIPIYETTYEKNDQIILEENDFVAFTSASTVRGFVQTMELSDYSSIRAVCIGKQTAAEAEKYNMQIAVSQQASLTSMVEQIIQLHQRQSD